MRTEAHLAEYRWIRMRELGWFFIGAWQVLSIASEFVPIDLESRILRVTGKVLGLLGLILVAYGFERLMRIEHAHAYPERWWRLTR